MNQNNVEYLNFVKHFIINHLHKCIGSEVSKAKKILFNHEFWTKTLNINSVRILMQYYFDIYERHISNSCIEHNNSRTWLMNELKTYSLSDSAIKSLLIKEQTYDEYLEYMSSHYIIPPEPHLSNTVKEYTIMQHKIIMRNSIIYNCIQTYGNPINMNINSFIHHWKSLSQNIRDIVLNHSETTVLTHSQQFEIQALLIIYKNIRPQNKNVESI